MTLRDIERARQQRETATAKLDRQHAAEWEIEDALKEIKNPSPSSLEKRIQPTVDGAELLDNVHQYLCRFVSYPNMHASMAHALWIAHTHLMDVWDSTPRLAFLSPEPGSGKTRALEVTELLVPNPVEAVNATPAYLFRKISDPDGMPTILFDEIDTLFGAKAREHEEVRGVLNAGHRKGAIAGRCVIKGKEVSTEELPAYCAVALAGLGNLPDTILSRSVIVQMRRRTPSERVEPFRRRVQLAEGHALRDQLSAWAEQITPSLHNTWPAMPTGIEDRNADIWEALLVIADAAGGDWPNNARVAAVAIVALSREAPPSLGVRLLADLKTIFNSNDALRTDDVLRALHELDESPWAYLNGAPLDSRRLSNLLRQYGVKSKNVRIAGGIFKGYSAEDLHDPWSRYLGGPAVPPAAPATSATSATPETEVAL